MNISVIQRTGRGGACRLIHRLRLILLHLGLTTHRLYFSHWDSRGEKMTQIDGYIMNQHILLTGYL